MGLLFWWGALSGPRVADPPHHGAEDDSFRRPDVREADAARVAPDLLNASLSMPTVHSSMSNTMSFPRGELSITLMEGWLIMTMRRRLDEENIYIYEFYIDGWICVSG